MFHGNTFFFGGAEGQEIDVFAAEHGSLRLKLLLCPQSKTFSAPWRILLGVLHHDGNEQEKESEVYDMKKRLVGILICSLLLVGCGSKVSSEEILPTENPSAAEEEENIPEDREEEENVAGENDEIASASEKTDKEETTQTGMIDCSTINYDEKKVDTHSELRTSFKSRILTDNGSKKYKEMTMVYLGHPRIMEAYENKDYCWYSSDPGVATAENGIITGWKEGTCDIAVQTVEGEEIETFRVIVSTFNDGKKADTYKEHESGYFKTDDAPHTPSNPEWVRENCNTILDFVVYLQDRNFIYNPDAPIMVTGETRWTWAEAGDIVLTNNYGVCCDVANAASYVLANDYERWGFVCITGAGGHIYNWFYEDSTFYIVDFTGVISDNREGRRQDPRSYIRMSFGVYSDGPSEEEVIDTYLQCNTNYSNCWVSYWVDATGYDFQPAVVLSWCHDGLDYPDKYIALEKETLETRTIIGYRNPNVECDIKAIDTDLIPSVVPTYGTRSNQDEIDKWNKYYRYDE